MPFHKRIGIFFLPIMLMMSVAPFSRAADSTSLWWDVKKLCEIQYGGRKAGTDGAGFCADYIAWRFKNSHYDSAVDTFRLAKGAIGRNVIATLPAKIENRSWIVVAAHFDGLGTMEGKTYPCADSNASGVAALLALAEFADPLPYTGIIFAALDGYTFEFAGAKALLSSLSDRKIKLFISLDTIGSDLSPVEAEHRNYLIALGAAPFKAQLEEAKLYVSGKLGPMSVYYDYYGSRDFTNLFYNRVGDQTPFLKAKIPSIVFTSGITYNTNRMSDIPLSLNYLMLLDRVRTISAFLNFL